MTRQLTKAQDESDLWRRKYEIDGVAKVYIINIGFFFHLNFKFFIQGRRAGNVKTENASSTLGI